MIHIGDQWYTGDIEACMPHKDSTQGTGEGQHGDIMTSKGNTRFLEGKGQNTTNQTLLKLDLTKRGCYVL